MTTKIPTNRLHAYACLFATISFFCDTAILLCFALRLLHSSCTISTCHICDGSHRCDYLPNHCDNLRNHHAKRHQVS